MPRQSNEQKLSQAQVAIDNVLADADLSTTLATFGYGTMRMSQGRQLYETAQELVQRQRSQYGQLYGAQDAYLAGRKQAHTAYMSYVKIARVVFEHDRGVQQTLGLAARRRSTLAGWLAQAQQFYSGALANGEILGRLAAFGLTAAALEAGLQQINAVIAGNTTRQQRRGSALHTTHQRDMAVARLHSWMSDFIKIARVALQDRPQLLAKLGLAAPVARRAGRSAEPATLSEPPGGDAPTAVLSAEPDAPASPRAARRNGRVAVGEGAG